MQHATAEIEVLIDDQNGGAEIARANRGREARATAAGDDDVDVVVPANAARLRRRFAGPEQRRSTQACRGARRDEVAPAQAAIGNVGTVALGLVLLSHVESSPESSTGTRVTNQSSRQRPRRHLDPELGGRPVQPIRPRAGKKPLLRSSAAESSEISTPMGNISMNVIGSRNNGFA